MLLLTELDYGMARTGNRFVARELARALKLNYAFAPCYLNLTKGAVTATAQPSGRTRRSSAGLQILETPICR